MGAIFRRKNASFVVTIVSARKCARCVVALTRQKARCARNLSVSLAVSNSSTHASAHTLASICCLSLGPEKLGTKINVFIALSLTLSLSHTHTHTHTPKND